MASVLYSSARAVSLEKTLLGADRLKRMLDGDVDDALKILSETGFSADGAKNDFNVVLNSETARLAAFIKEAAPDEKIKKFFLYPFDFRNAEALIKAKYLKTEPVLTANGCFDVKVLKEKIFVDEYTSFPPFMAKALNASDKAFTENLANGLYVNSIFTKALYEELFALKIKDARLNKILRAKADMINLGIAFRTRNVLKAEKQFVRFGELRESELKTVCESDFDEIREKFRFSDYKDEIYAALSGLESGAGLKEFEKMSDGYAVKLIKKNRYNSEGAFPFIRYCFYKSADIANARIILVGLSAGLTGAEISERLREGYEG